MPNFFVKYFKKYSIAIIYSDAVNNIIDNQLVT